MIEFSASLPPLQSAISIDGQEGNCVRLKLDCLLSAGQIAKLMEMRGQELKIVIKNALEE